jgi:hypothetical protein
MLLGYLALIIGLIATVVSVVIATSASQLVLTALSTVISLPVSAAVVTSWIAGACCLLAYRQLTLPKAQNEKILQTWDKQDVKLAAEIQSDKVKQLEAKINTLETALSSALKKKKDKV